MFSASGNSSLGGTIQVEYSLRASFSTWPEIASFSRYIRTKVKNQPFFYSIQVQFWNQHRAALSDTVNYQ